MKLSLTKEVATRIDGQTDGFTIANKALCIANYAYALQKIRARK